MKKLGHIISFLVLVCSTNRAVAQSHLSKYNFIKPLNTNAIFNTSVYNLPVLKFTSSFSDNPSNVIPFRSKPMIEKFHYSAFFCKMELKSLNYLGIWVKVHAGDYDSYVRGYSHNNF